jgi:hypothetical protein
MGLHLLTDIAATCPASSGEHIKEVRMLIVTTRVGIGIALGLGITGSVIGISNYNASETDTPLAEACAGLPTNHRLESALFDARAQSIGGFDAICDAVEDSLAPGIGADLRKSENGDVDIASGLDPKLERRSRLRGTANRHIRQFPRADIWQKATDTV